MMPREEALQTITDAIAWLVAQADLRGAIHLFDSHIIAQEVFRRLLNELHGLQLEVTDNIHQNFPAIDLGDAGNKRCFQVTSESRGRKIQETLNAYAANGLKSRFGKLQVLVIGKRQQTYSLKVPPGVAFDWKKDIIDSKELVRQISAKGTETILRIREVIEQEIRPPEMGSQDEGKPLQSSKLSRFYLPLKFPTVGDSKEVDAEVFGKFSDVMLDAFSRCFQHTSVRTGRDDFVFLLTLARTDRETDPGYAPFDFEVICHVTEFVRVLEARLGFIYAGMPTSPPRLRKFGGDQEVMLNSWLGRYMPHRIWRDPPSAIRIQLLDGIPPSPGDKTTTSVLLSLLSGSLNGLPVVMDDAEQLPELKKVLKVFARKKRRPVSLDSITLDQDDPESWEYHG